MGFYKAQQSDPAAQIRFCILEYDALSAQAAVNCTLSKFYGWCKTRDVVSCYVFDLLLNTPFGQLGHSGTRVECQVKDEENKRCKVSSRSNKINLFSKGWTCGQLIGLGDLCPPFFLVPWPLILTRRRAWAGNRMFRGRWTSEVTMASQCFAKHTLKRQLLIYFIIHFRFYCSSHLSAPGLPRHYSIARAMHATKPLIFFPVHLFGP